MTAKLTDELVEKPRRIVVLTGAGISAESGVRTFRDSNGLWEDHHIEDVATPEGFARDPDLVQRFYNARRAQLKEVKPNAAHYALARFEQAFDGDFLIITQNVDNLHERAGSRQLLHMHGELQSVRCVETGDVFEHLDDITHDTLCECCQQPNLRPHIVWFGEMPFYMDAIYAALFHCDLFISVGTSGHVYPAAGFVELANQHGAHSIEINLEPGNVKDAFDQHVYGKAGEILPDYLDEILAMSYAR